MRFATLCLIAGLACACVPKPEKNYTPDEIANVTSLQELMRINADRADPLFAIRDNSQFTPAEMTRMSNAVPILEATAKQIATFAGKGEYDDGFAEYAGKLGAAAQKLQTASDSDSAKQASAALSELKQVCADCHGIYK